MNPLVAEQLAARKWREFTDWCTWQGRRLTLDSLKVWNRGEMRKHKGLKVTFENLTVAEADSLIEHLEHMRSS